MAPSHGSHFPELFRSSASRMTSCLSGSRRPVSVLRASSFPASQSCRTRSGERSSFFAASPIVMIFIFQTSFLGTLIPDPICTTLLCNSKLPRTKEHSLRTTKSRFKKAKRKTPRTDQSKRRIYYRKSPRFLEQKESQTLIDLVNLLNLRSSRSAGAERRKESDREDIETFHTMQLDVRDKYIREKERGMPVKEAPATARPDAAKPTLANYLDWKGSGYKGINKKSLASLSQINEVLQAIVTIDGEAIPESKDIQLSSADIGTWNHWKKLIHAASTREALLEIFEDLIRERFRQLGILADIGEYGLEPLRSPENADWISASCLYFDLKREPRRLKKCIYCKRFFWDHSMNMLAKICGEKRCANLRDSLRMDRVRKNKMQKRGGRK